MASNRVFVQQGVYQQFADMLSEEVRKLQVGQGFEENVNMG
ncbi:aldehyde dehydrogenase family protein [archaeon]|nr:MAG: aldehyde dehydrogenase family protein [archaeon]